VCCEQAQEEIDRVLGDSDQPDMAGYTQLKYLMRCINESMRLYPHPPVLLRRAEIADTLPGDLCHPNSSLSQLSGHAGAKSVAQEGVRTVYIKVE
jgi:hypothetical protein